MTAAVPAVEAGDVLAERSVHITRETLVRYAGASGDFNPIHYRDDVAEAAGLPGVIAHGMLTMGLAVGVLVDAIGDPGRVIEYGCRFARPVVVHPESGVDLQVRATVASVSDGIASVSIDAIADGVKVLVKAVARVAL